MRIEQYHIYRIEKISLNGVQRSRFAPRKDLTKYLYQKYCYTVYSTQLFESSKLEF